MHWRRRVCLRRAVETCGFFNPYAPVAIHERNLPHWQQAGALVFLTWRLADALPAGRLAEWEAELAQWKSRHPPPWDAATTAEYRAQFPARIERWLDAGAGECLLRRPEIAERVEASLRRFDGTRYDAQAFVIMPNHVHAIVRLVQGWKLEQVVQGWKSWTSHEINRALGRRGTLWQEGYWDRLVRDAGHLARCIAYIERNPEQARLREGEFRLWVKEGVRG